MACEIITPQRAEEAAIMAINISCFILFYLKPNETVGKVLLTSENDVLGGLLTLPKHEIVDCSAFYEITFFRISPKNLLGDFFDRFNVRANLWPLAIRLSEWLCDFMFSNDLIKVLE